MKKLFAVLAATLICGTIVFTSCSKDKEDNNTDLNLKEKLVGKWLYIEADGQKVETAESSVTTFAIEGSTLKAYTSISMKDYGLWAFHQPTEVTVDGDKITLTMHQGDLTTVEEMTDISVDGDNLRYTSRYTILRSGEVILELPSYRLRCTKVHDDYANAVLGTWEMLVQNGDSQQIWRWNYKADGTYVFSMKNGDEPWQDFEDVMSDYFVDGPLLCTRWQNAGTGNEEHREWWEIESIENGVMRWTALRQREDGTTYTETFEMEKVN